MRKLSLKVISVVFLMMFLAHLDRSNVAFAARELQRDFGLTATQFGTGVSLFFVTYVVLAIPATLLLRWGSARVWLARVLIAWGIVAAVTALMQGAASFYALRLLLGAAEAGFMPFVIAFTSGWLPAKYRARMMGIFLLGVPISGVIGAPISGFLIDQMDGQLGLSGWRWMFLLEGVPTILCGIFTSRVLSDRPSDVHWMSPGERTWLQDTIDAEMQAKLPVGEQRSLSLAASPAILLLGFTYAMTGFAANGSNFFQPLIIGEANVGSNTVVGIVTAIPLLAGAISMYLLSALADRHRRYRWTASAAYAVSGLGFLLASLSLHHPPIALVGLVIAAAGLFATMPLILAMPLQVFTGPAIAAGVALLNTMSNVGSFLGPVVIGVARDRTGDYSVSLAVFSVSVFMGGLVLFNNRHFDQSPHIATGK